ncbi:hypothetical protein C7453_11562, partial [Gluconacetobacter liquefaciens]
FDAFMKLSSSRLRDHTWKIPTQIGRVFGEHVSGLEVSEAKRLKALEDENRH